MPMASMLSTVATVIGLLLIAYAAFYFASALVAGARRRDDRAVRGVSRAPDRSDSRR